MLTEEDSHHSAQIRIAVTAVASKMHINRISELMMHPGPLLQGSKIARRRAPIIEAPARMVVAKRSCRDQRPYDPARLCLIEVT